MSKSSWQIYNGVHNINPYNITNSFISNEWLEEIEKKNLNIF